MILINQSSKILYTNESDGTALLKRIEYAGRNCYASQDRITEDSYKKFIKNLITRGHEAPLEFADITFDITTSRAVLAEITRHRLASFCVESQRYIQEAKTGDITFIKPEWDTELPEDTECITWRLSMIQIENDYKNLIADGMKPEEAREVLPNSTACRIIMKANVREWRHFFNLRCSKAAYPQMRSLALGMLSQAYSIMPEAFEDIYESYFKERNEENG